MKIVIVNTVSEFGSTGKIVTILKEGYEKAGHQVLCFYGGRKENDSRVGFIKVTKPYESYLSAFFYRLTGFQGVFLSKSTKRLIKGIEAFNPDIVHLMNIHGYYIDEFKLLNYLSKKNYPTVYSMMDEYAYTGKCPFTYKCDKFKTQCGHCPAKKNQYPVSWFFDRTSYYFTAKERVYNKFSRLVFTGTPWTIWRAKQSCLLGNRSLKAINEPIDLDRFFFPKEAEGLRAELGIPVNNIIILTIALLSSDNKGGKFFLELYDKMKDLPNYSFVYVGFDTDKYGDYDGMIKIPYVSSLSKLSEFCCMADVFISTTMADTIPNAAIDALGSGTPVCGFNISGLSFIGIDDKSIVKLSPVFDVEALKCSVLTFQKKTATTIKKCRNSVYGKYDPKTIVKEYLSLFEELIY